MVSRQFIKFFITGGLAALCNIGSRYFFSLFVGFQFAVGLAYLVGMTVAYILARLFVFERSGRNVKSEFSRFALVNLFSFFLVWFISVTLAFVVFPAIHFTWHPEDVAHFIGVIAPAAVSFFGHRYFSFKAVSK